MANQFTREISSELAGNNDHATQRTLGLVRHTSALICARNLGCCLIATSDKIKPAERTIKPRGGFR
jgi:hypothetical protein